ncbi:MAG TPA: DUF3306 domain-containing protein [Caldimonas sp.]|nr:DUF3306 domain-containing protein [Caldimonas sp.]
MAGDGFVSRWTRRKAEARAGAVAPDAAPASSPLDARVELPLPTPPAASEPAAPTAGAAPAPAAAPLPTLDDVARLTKDSDFSPFVARNVDADVRNAAMKKLFSDPHFNVMDGLDTYIDDYGKADPIPLSMLRRMNQSATLGLFDKEVDPGVSGSAPPAPSAQACPDGGGPAAVAQSPAPPPLPSDTEPAPDPRTDDDPDLQLQPDDADRRAGAGPSPRD